MECPVSVVSATVSSPSLGDGDPTGSSSACPIRGTSTYLREGPRRCAPLEPARSDGKSGEWWFDGMPQRCVTVQGLRRAPAPGHYTAERTLGDQAFALFDQMPEGTVLTLVIVFRPQYQVLNHIARIVRAAIGEGAESLLGTAASVPYLRSAGCRGSRAAYGASAPAAPGSRGPGP
jgi:hypothetical protein